MDFSGYQRASVTAKTEATRAKRLAKTQALLVAGKAEPPPAGARP